MHKNSIPSINNDQPIRHPSLPKKSTNINFYNSIYESAFPVNSSNLPNDSPLSHQQTTSFSTDDLAQLETFDEQSIITHMYNRFLANQIYTYIGDILVVSYLITAVSHIQEIGGRDLSLTEKRSHISHRKRAQLLQSKGVSPAGRVRRVRV